MKFSKTSTLLLSMYGIFLGVLFPKIGMFGCTTKFLFSKNYYYSLFTAQLLYKIGLVFTHFFLLKKKHFHSSISLSSQDGWTPIMAYSDALGDRPLYQWRKPQRGIASRVCGPTPSVHWRGCGLNCQRVHLKITGTLN